MEFECIVVGSHLRYDGVRQRPQHIVSRLARRAPVLFVEEPFAAQNDENERIVHDGVDILRPRRRGGDGSIDTSLERCVTDWIGERPVLFWLYSPMMSALADVAPAAPLVYDCMDELAAFAFAPASMRERERALLERADIVFAGGRSLYDGRRALGDKVRLEPSGVECERFEAAASLAMHPLFAHLARPLCAYVGVIDERIDLAIVERLAECVPSVALVGPVVKIEPSAVPRRANVHCTGQMPYADLPALLAGTDVAIMPFARNAATEAISPTKTLEYLAAGKPVVSTSITDVVADFSDIVTLADGPEAFTRACLESAPNRQRSERGSARARRHSWDAIVERMWAALERE